MMLKFHDEIAPILPNSPGVYIMKNVAGKIIYVGKAKNLKKRVTSYFVGEKKGKTALLVKTIDSIEFILTAKESEALLLENNLIKKHMPKYNISLKDGKTYPVLRITNETWPRIFKTRSIINDGSRYFGPFTDVRMLDTYISLIKKLFPLRRCKGVLKKRDFPCLYSHLNLCLAPCTGQATEKQYKKMITQIEALLAGDNQELTIKLQREMEKAAKLLHFEEAVAYRDALKSLQTISATQDIIDFDPEVRDFISYIIEDEEAVFSVFQMREGHMSGRDLIPISPCLDNGNAIQSFLIQYYERYHELPDHIIINADFPLDGLANYFLENYEKRVTLSHPETKREWSVIKMGEENCRHEHIRLTRKRLEHPGVEELFQLFQLPHRPIRIEGFDISHLHGKYTVASLITFEKGHPNPSGYRTFNIRTLKGKIDDFESIREATARRYSRLINEKKPLPHLILIDGGAGQVSAAKGIIDSLGLRIPILGLAEKEEEIYCDGGGPPIRLPIGSEGLILLQAIRDETHRFATSKSFKKRETDLHFAQLEKIVGIGKKRSIQLMKQYGSLDSLRMQSPEVLQRECGIPLAVGAALLANLNS